MASVKCPWCNLVLPESHQEHCPRRGSQVQSAIPITAKLTVPESPSGQGLVAGGGTPVSLVQEKGISPPLISAPSGNHRLDIPDIDPHYMLTQGIQDKLDRVFRLSKLHPVNVLLTGPQGSGKTSLARQFAAKHGRVCYTAPCVTMQEPKEWWGSQHFTPERGTYYLPALFTEAIQTPAAVILLDDINRVENPKVVNPLFPLLDDRRASWIEEMQTVIRVAQGVIFFATMNEGWEFQGTDPFDKALRDRFYQVRMDYPPAFIIAKIVNAKTGLDSSQAIKLSRLAEALRENAQSSVEISLRQLLLISEDIVIGASIRDAVVYTVIPGLQPDEQTTVLQSLQQELGESEIRQSKDDNWSVWK